jgi:hypothetical protein
MSPMILINNEYVSLQYHPGKKIVHHELKQWVPTEPFREALTKEAELFEKYGAQKLLSDDRGNGALYRDAEEWATNVWGPRAINAGWQYWAIVMPEKALGKMNMRSIISMYAEKGITVQTFANTDEAMHWLESL